RSAGGRRAGGVSAGVTVAILLVLWEKAMNLRNLNTKVGSARCGKIQCCLVVTDPAIHSLLDRCCSSFNFETHLVEWDVPTPRYLFEAERDAESAQLDCWRVKHRTGSRRSCERLKLVYD